MRITTLLRCNSGQISRLGGGTSLYEAALEEKRAAIRRALKNEYNRRIYDPKRTDPGPIFDSGLMRFEAFHADYAKYFKANWRAYGRVVMTIVLPMYLIYLVVSDDVVNFELACRRGEIAYDHPRRLVKYML